MTQNDKEMGRHRSEIGDHSVPDFASAQRHLRAALEALSTDPDDYGKEAVNLIGEGVYEATLRLEKMIEWMKRLDLCTSVFGDPLLSKPSSTIYQAVCCDGKSGRLRMNDDRTVIITSLKGRKLSGK